VVKQHLHKLLLILIKVLQLVLLGYPAAIPAVAAATVAGFGAVKNIVNQIPTRADGGAYQR
jgi:Sec-independent protein translocase protein TatA